MKNINWFVNYIVPSIVAIYLVSCYLFFKMNMVDNPATYLGDGIFLFATMIGTTFSWAIVERYKKEIISVKRVDIAMTRWVYVGGNIVTILTGMGLVVSC